MFRIRASARRLGLIVAIASFSLVAQADSIFLTGTVRDFKGSNEDGGHPDFENTVIKDDPGIVGSTISATRKPVYAHGSGSTLTTHGSTFFDQWYNDVDGVNLSTPYSLVLSNDTSLDSSTYTFSDGAFFPIDGQLFGNTTPGYPDHNYGFTFELHSNFTYQPGQSFHFSGDDDVFVYINDKLVIDLGGVHDTRFGDVDLDTLGLTPGSLYNFDFFFAERHTTGSNFSMTTSIPLIDAATPLPTPATATLVLLAVAALPALRKRLRPAI